MWTLTWTDPDSGRTRSVSTRATERDAAEIWRAQWLAGRARPLPPAQPLIAEILDGYLADRAEAVADLARLKDAALALKRHIGRLEPHMLGRRAYLDRRRPEGVGDGTLRREVGVLRAALNWALRERWIAAADLPYIQSAPLPPPRERWLSREEMAALIAACAAPHLRLFVILAYHTAARAGAILDLTWDRVDLVHRRVDYRRPGRRATDKRRATVPLNAVALAALQEARRLATGAAEADADLAGARVVEFRGKPVRSVRHAFAEACRRAGIADCSPHVIRHTAATHMVMAGVPLAEIARMLGDTEAMIEKVYGKHHPDYLRRAADALAGDPRPRSVSRATSEK